MTVVRVSGEIVTVVCAATRCPLVSVAVMLTTKVPFVLKVVVKLVPTFTTGVPCRAVQLNVYGKVPPVAAAVNVSGCPTVPVEGPLIVADRVNGLMVIVADAVADRGVGVDESVAFADIVYVPLTLYMVANVVPVPVEGLPPVAVQANVIGGVPPETAAAHVTAVPSVPVVGQVTVNASDAEPTL